MKTLDGTSVCRSTPRHEDFQLSARGEAICFYLHHCKEFEELGSPALGRFLFWSI